MLANDSLKLNNTLNICLRSLRIILYYSQQLNTCECLISQIYQQPCNQLKNHTHFLEDTSLELTTSNPLDTLHRQILG